MKTAKFYSKLLVSLLAVTKLSLGIGMNNLSPDATPLLPSHQDNNLYYNALYATGQNRWTGLMETFGVFVLNSNLVLAPKIDNIKKNTIIVWSDLSLNDPLRKILYPGNTMRLQQRFFYQLVNVSLNNFADVFNLGPSGAIEEPMAAQSTLSKVYTLDDITELFVLHQPVTYNPPQTLYVPSFKKTIETQAKFEAERNNTLRLIAYGPATKGGPDLKSRDQDNDQDYDALTPSKWRNLGVFNSTPITAFAGFNDSGNMALAHTEAYSDYQNDLGGFIVRRMPHSIVYLGMITGTKRISPRLKVSNKKNII